MEEENETKVENYEVFDGMLSGEHEVVNAVLDTLNANSDGGYTIEFEGEGLDSTVTLKVGEETVLEKIHPLTFVALIANLAEVVYNNNVAFFLRVMELGSKNATLNESISMLYEAFKTPEMIAVLAMEIADYKKERGIE